MAEGRDRYYLTEVKDGQPVEREVTLEEYCRAERNAGFRPKGLSSTDPNFMTTPATGSFGSSRSSVSGRTRWEPANELKGPM